MQRAGLVGRVVAVEEQQVARVLGEQLAARHVGDALAHLALRRPPVTGTTCSSPSSICGGMPSSRGFFDSSRKVTNWPSGVTRRSAAVPGASSVPMPAHPGALPAAPVPLAALPPPPSAGVPALAAHHRERRERSHHHESSKPHHALLCCGDCGTATPGSHAARSSWARAAYFARLSCFFTRPGSGGNRPKMTLEGW